MSSRHQRRTVVGPTRKQITFSLRENQVATLRSLAKEQEKSLSAVVAELVINSLSNISFNTEAVIKEPVIKELEYKNKQLEELKEENAKLISLVEKAIESEKQTKEIFSTNQQ